jgi:hydroxymethylpyrimidine pyrophosphatase-like HAD family hydrolase
MVLKPSIDRTLRGFVGNSRFDQEGAVITDLDGTAVHELDGRVVIPDAVSHGLKHLRDLGHPVILNTLRFPLNVIRTFGREWYAITNAPLPLISLNGSLMGFLHETIQGEIAFDEIQASPLVHSEIDEVLTGVEGLVQDGITDLIVFYYPRDWTRGELIWTPVRERVAEVRAKYGSASAVISSSVTGLREILHAQEVCMMLLLVNVEEDRLMAYQHAKRSNFVTHKGIDKLSGTRTLANLLNIDLAQAVGAGDSPMDSFLKGVGLAVQVGGHDTEYKGLLATIKVDDSLEFGAVLFRLSQLQRGEHR